MGLLAGFRYREITRNKRYGVLAPLLVTAILPPPIPTPMSMPKETPEKSTDQEDGAIKAK